VQAACMQAHPKLMASLPAGERGGGVTMFSAEVEEEANALFQRIFSGHGMPMDDVISLLKSLKGSKTQRYPPPPPLPPLTPPPASKKCLPA
jgi:hypothetical protein